MTATIKKRSFRGERGNVLFMILLAIVVLGALTMAISQNSTEQSDVIPRQTQDDQINRMLTYASALGSALQQMVVSGENPLTLYSSLSLLKPGDAGFETSPNNLKIYHPLGGGITYQSASSPDTNAIATNFNINAGSIITGVGATNTIGDIVFVATVSSAAYCARINQILYNSAAVPTMNSATFTSLFTNNTTVTVNGGNCASCVNMKQYCVTNGSGAWGFYAALLPG